MTTADANNRVRPRSGRRTAHPFASGLAAASIALAACSPGTAGAADLLDIYDRARGADTRTAIAAADADAADARYRQARGVLLPDLRANASLTRLSQERTFDVDAPGFDSDESTEEQENYGLTLEQPLFDWSAFRGWAAADQQRESVRQQLTAAERGLMRRAAERYFDVLSAREAETSARDVLQVIEAQLDRARAAHESGLAPITEVQEAESRLDGARVDAIAAENDLETARDALARLVGGRPGELAPPTDWDTPIQPQGPLSRWLARAEANSAVLAAARASMEAARAEADARWGQRLPSLSLQGRLGRSEQTFPVGPGGADIPVITESESLTLQLEMPLFTGGRLTAEIDEAQASAVRARLEYVDTARQLRNDVRGAYRDASAAARRTQALHAAWQSARTAAEAARAGYQTGTRNILDVLDAEVTSVQRRLDWHRAWLEAALAQLRLKENAGVLDRDDLAMVNAHLGDGGSS